LVSGVFLLSAITPAFSQVSQFGDPVVASANDFEIPRSQLEDAFITFRAIQTSNGQVLPDSQRREAEIAQVKRLIFTELLVRMATDGEKTRGTEQAENLIQDQITRARSETAFRQNLVSLGLTLEEFKKQVTDQGVSEEVMLRTLADKIAVTDEEVRKYYDDRPEDFKYPEQARVAHILISTVDQEQEQPMDAAKIEEQRQLAERILGLAKSGEPFADLVKQYSNDTASISSGGEYTISRGQMVPEFEAASFSMMPGQISDLVQTRYGFHIIKSLEKIPSRMEPFENVAADIRKRLELINLQKNIPDYMEQLLKENDFKLFEENF
jgi:parvulin-like peptidyl-prolyl isomerase